jgi:hypothetical protein
MTAYELADELWEKYLDNNECQHGYALSSGCPNDDCKEQALYDAANMLRQQADRIAELEKDGKVCATCGGLVYDPVLKQTKPAHDFNTLTLDTGEKRSLNRLSDEEILDLTIWNKNFYELYVEMEKEDMIAFARAIEERHGIK